MSCSWCGQRQEQNLDPGLALAWASERVGDQLRWLCPNCARAHVRDIEGQLPAEWW